MGFPEPACAGRVCSLVARACVPLGFARHPCDSGRPDGVPTLGSQSSNKVPGSLSHLLWERFCADQEHLFCTLYEGKTNSFLHAAARRHFVLFCLVFYKRSEYCPN